MKKILLLLLFLSGCSSKPITLVPTPDNHRLASLKYALDNAEANFEAINLSEEMAKTYLEAKKAETAGSLKKACSLFEKVSGDRSFPIHQAALLHTLKICTYSASELMKIWKKTDIASYLKEAYLEQSLLLAFKYKIEVYIAEFSYDLSKYKQVQSEKVELLKNALAIAEKLNLPEQMDLYFRRLVEVSPMFSKEVNATNIYTVAKDYETNRLFEKAQSLYREIIFTDKFSLAERIKAYNSYRTSYKVQRNLKVFLEKTGEMQEWTGRLLELSPSDKELQEAWIESKIAYARAIWTDHQNLEARKILEGAMTSKLGNVNQKATIFWVYGSLHVEVKENEDAIKKFQSALALQPTDNTLLENLQWAIVWNKYLLKKNKDVVSDVIKYVSISTNPNFIHKLNFWKAKAFVRMNNNEEAKEQFQMTLAEDPFGYYGLLASMEINESLNPLPPTIINTDPTGILILDWLIAMNEEMLSEKYLKEIDPQFKTIAQRERAMSLYAQTKWFQGGMRQIYSFPLIKRNSFTEKYVSVVFPIPYSELVEEFANKYQVPKALVYSIIRQESAFNPNVRSWADAFGLMQLIPEKASELSKRHQIPYKEYNDLYMPALNLELGTALLSELRELFKSKFAQSVASYNASTEVIAVWERERFNGDYLEFIEMIPYEETRNYIKLVFRNYITYKRILDQSQVTIDPNFFELPFN